ncbi:uncharacterized protein LOC125653548 [Ostrea edulis]|uniref:uncharacterized protein LOC125653548 n=1 Tax=Ostrea edulis TaxID=37623 RepID=UPI0024AF659C|nr:uncharacterized protein LOC125653548 [Ostrea edulis]
MEEIFATQVRPDGSASSMTCENGAKLHQRVMNWNRTKLFDVCGNGLIIPKGYYAVLSEDLTRITIYEQSECGEKQRCPAKDYYSYEIVPLYCRHNNETYEFRDYMFSAQNRDISPRCNAGSYLTSSAGIPSILKGTLFSVAIVIIVRSV